MKIQVICNYCGWKGRTKQLNGIRCPKCDNGKYIVDAEQKNFLPLLNLGQSGTQK